MESVECRYRGRVIGFLVEGPDGFLRYERIRSWNLATTSNGSPCGIMCAEWYLL